MSLNSINDSTYLSDQPNATAPGLSTPAGRVSGGADPQKTVITYPFRRINHFKQ